MIRREEVEKKEKEKEKRHLKWGEISQGGQREKGEEGGCAPTAISLPATVRLG